MIGVSDCDRGHDRLRLAYSHYRTASPGNPLSMARRPRLHVPGGFYHVMLRGNGSADIFFVKAHRQRFLALQPLGSARTTSIT